MFRCCAVGGVVEWVGGVERSWCWMQELVAAAKRNDPESASLAMRLGADALLGDINGWTPLHWASAANSVDVATVSIMTMGNLTCLDHALVC